MASELIAEAITDYFGERCLDYAEGCPTCEAWAEYDRWNTRTAPAATDTGLKTIGFVPPMFVEGKGADYNDIFRSVSIAENYTALVTRSQAEELLAAERAEKEKERLRFEGDLDKWMKIIGAGITGYQPEAYALMDLACEELVKLRADNAAQAARIKELEEKLGTATALETCCCGDPVDTHNMGSGHSPVDQYHYAMVQLEAKLAAAEKALKPFAEAALGYDDPDENGPWPDIQDVFVTLGDCRRARAVLGGKPS